MNVLFVGDVVGECGRRMLFKYLPKLKQENNVNFAVVNGENSAKGNGISPQSAKDIFDSGADVITTGNHIWHKKEIGEFLENNPFVLRPANYPDLCSGNGYVIFDMGRFSICVINLLGTVFLESLNSPFEKADEIIKKITDTSNIIIVDIHAEATSEKKALAHYLDGRVSAVIGTHTHTQTADEQILQNGCGYISDVGMTGAFHSILGIKPEIIVKKFLTKQPIHFEQQEGIGLLNAVLLCIDEKSGKCTKIERVNVKEV